MQNPSAKDGEYRQLRAITILAFVLGSSLLLPYGVNSGRAFPAVGIAPLFLSACSGVLIFTGRLRLAGKKALSDFSLALLYLSFLVPSWLEIEGRGNHRWVSSGETMLASYGSAVMMMNFAIHIFFAIQASRIGDLDFPTLVWKSSACPDCQHHRHQNRAPSVAGHRIGFSGDGVGISHERGVMDVHRPFMQCDDDEEEESRASSEYQTSGFDSPRRSAETLTTDFRHDADV